VEALLRRTGAALKSSIGRALPALAIGGFVVAFVVFA
jgi:hypothetical protein